MAETSFQLAGVRVLVRSSDDVTATLPEAYARYARAAGRPDLVVDVRHDAALENQPPGPGYPGFARRRAGGHLEVARADVAGSIALSDDVVTARFRIADHASSLEACLRVALSVALPRHGALVMHGSAVIAGGRGHLFSGVSGAGKSTIARLLADAAGCERLADDLAIIARGDAGWSIEVPPFLGTTGLPHGRVVPLASIDLLVQAPAHRRTTLPRGDAIRELLRHVAVFAAEESTSASVLDLVARLVGEVPVHRLEFALDAGVADALELR